MIGLYDVVETPTDGEFGTVVQIEDGRALVAYDEGGFDRFDLEELTPAGDFEVTN